MNSLHLQHIYALTILRFAKEENEKKIVQKKVITDNDMKGKLMTPKAVKILGC